jgi:hypothetical protein
MGIKDRKSHIEERQCSTHARLGPLLISIDRTLERYTPDCGLVVWPKASFLEQTQQNLKQNEFKHFERRAILPQSRPVVFHLGRTITSVPHRNMIRLGFCMQNGANHTMLICKATLAPACTSLDEHTPLCAYQCVYISSRTPELHHVKCIGRGVNRRDLKRLAR